MRIKTGYYESFSEPPLTARPQVMASWNDNTITSQKRINPHSPSWAHWALKSLPLREIQNCLTLRWSSVLEQPVSPSVVTGPTCKSRYAVVYPPHLRTLKQSKYQKGPSHGGLHNTCCLFSKSSVATEK